MLAAIPGQVPVVFRSLAANLGQVAVVLAVILDQAPAANLDRVAAVAWARLDVSPQAVESGSVARFPVATRSEAQSRQSQEARDAQDALEDAANLDQDAQEMEARDARDALATEEVLDQVARERQARCDQGQQEPPVKCCQDARLV